MILRNGRNMFKYILGTDGKNCLYDTDGNIITNMSFQSISGNSYSCAKHGCILVGTGVSDPNYTDNNLGTNITATLSAGTPKRTFDVDNASGELYLQIDQTFTNNTGSDVVITEYGIANDFVNGQKTVLLTKDLVGGEGIKIENGKSVIITAKFI